MPGVGQLGLCTRSYDEGSMGSFVMSQRRTSTFPALMSPRNLGSRSAATTFPVGPVRSESQRTTDPAPAPTSRQCQPAASSPLPAEATPGTMGTAGLHPHGDWPAQADDDIAVHLGRPRQTAGVGGVAIATFRPGRRKEPLAFPTRQRSITATPPAVWRTRSVTTWNRLVQQWRKHAPTLAAVFALLAVVGGGVAVVQGRMLTAQGWIVRWGMCPNRYGRGFLAGFLALLIAVLEWRSGQVERRDREADQARLMIAELVTDGQVQGRGVRRRRVILRVDGSGGQCRWGVLLFRCGVVVGAGFAQDVQAEVAAGLGPFVVLFGQHRSDEADQRGAVGEDADDVGAPPDLLVRVAPGDCSTRSGARSAWEAW